MNISVQIDEGLEPLIDRYVAEGRFASREDYLLRAARRYAEDLMAESDLVTIALEGIADAEAGNFITIASTEDAEALIQDIMSRAIATVEATSDK